MSMFKNAQNAHGLWEDPEFGADDTSLSWSKYGFEAEPDAFPMGTKWKRPSEMGEGLSNHPSLWGDYGAPVPYGI